MKKKSVDFKIFFFVFIFICFLFCFPRLLVFLLKESPWVSYLYTYGLGGLLFFVSGFFLHRSGAYQPFLREEKKWYQRTLLCVFLFASLHALWIVCALFLPFYG